MLLLAPYRRRRDWDYMYCSAAIHLAVLSVGTHSGELCKPHTLVQGKGPEDARCEELLLSAIGRARSHFSGRRRLHALQVSGFSLSFLRRLPSMLLHKAPIVIAVFPKFIDQRCCSADRFGG